MDAARELGMVEPGPVLPLVPPVIGTRHVRAGTGRRRARTPVEVGAAASTPDDEVSAGGG